MSAAFDRAYSPIGRPSIPLERLLRALRLQAFHSIRSERQLMERLDLVLLFRWFVGLVIDDPVRDASTYAKNRYRFLDSAGAGVFWAGVVNHPDIRHQMNRDPFSVDGTLVDAWASMKSFIPKDASPKDASPKDANGPGAAGDGARLPAGGRNADRDFREQKRSNNTHASTTDLDARLYRKGSGQTSRLRFIGSALMANRNALVVDGRLTLATGQAKTLSALDLADAHLRPGTILASDKGHDTRDVVAEQRQRCITPPVAHNRDDTGTARRRPAIDAHTTRHPGDAVSQRIRKRIEEIFGWIKTVAGWQQSRFRRRERTEYGFIHATDTLTRMPKILATEATA